MKLAVDIVLDVLQYLDPDKLDNVAESAKWWICVVNSMDKAVYIERWLDMGYHYTLTYEANNTEIGVFLENRWYFKLQFKNESYPILLDYIKNKNKNKIWWDKRLFIDVSHAKIQYTDLDVNGIGAIHSLAIMSCDKISDVSSLGGVHSLNLGHCWGDKNWGSLGYVHNLYLECSEISDVSSLGGVCRLNLYECDELIDVSSLGGVYDLNIGYCASISNVSGLGGVKKLNIGACYYIGSVNSLGGVHTLDLEGCEISDVSNLGSVHSLNISYCGNISDVSSLGGVHTLNLCHCDNIQEDIWDVSSLVS